MNPGRRKHIVFSRTKEGSTQKTGDKGSGDIRPGSCVERDTQNRNGRKTDLTAEERDRTEVSESVRSSWVSMYWRSPSGGTKGDYLGHQRTGPTCSR